MVAAVTNLGKKIVIVSLSDGKVKTVCNRGITAAGIFCIDFSPDNKYLCISNHKNSIHVFNIGDEIDKQ